MFERCTADARAVVAAARAHAARLGHDPADTEHLLLALVDACPAMHDALTGTDLVAAITAHLERPLDPDRRALATLGIDLDRVRDAVDRTFGPGAFMATRPRTRAHRRDRPRRSFSPQAAKVLERSLRETLRLGQRAIAPEHIALGLLREGKGLAAVILAEHGVDPVALRGRLEEAALRAEPRVS